MALYWIAVAAAPALILLAGGRLAPRSRLALIGSAIAAWAITTAAMDWFVPDPSFIAPLLIAFYLVMPVLGAAIAAIVATRVVATRGRLAAALTLALLGWIAGLVVGVVLDLYLHATSRYLWDYALSLALPASWSAAAAVLAAGVGRRD